MNKEEERTEKLPLCRSRSKGDKVMITLTRLNGSPVTVNLDLIETLDVMPDTLITMTTGRKLVVKESPAEIIEKAVLYKARICQMLNILRKDGCEEHEKVE